MLNSNPLASEAIFSAAYVDNYIDSVENLPDDVQRKLSRIRDIDVQYRSHLRDVDHYHEVWKTLEKSQCANTVNKRARAIARMQASLILAQERGDEKMLIVNQLQELIDHKTRQLDLDQRNLDIKEEQNQHQVPQRVNDITVPPQKVLRTQSPIRDNSLSNSGSNAMGEATPISGNTSNDTATPTTTTTERTAYNSTLVGNMIGGGNGTQNLTNVQAVNGSIAESQRSSCGKRSRRRHDTVNSQSQIDSLYCNESNSASNEAGSSSGANEKNTISSIGSVHHKVATNNGSAAQKKISSSSNGQAIAGGSQGNANGTIASLNLSTGTIGIGNNSGKKRKRKTRGAQAANSHNTRDDTPPPDPDPIDPDEPTYCLCDRISFGEMILCDNDLCPIEWFHFSCVSLILKPKGKWYCPNCRGDRPNIMKPKAQFLKELERYNKEKEEKT